MNFKKVCKLLYIRYESKYKSMSLRGYIKENIGKGHDILMKEVMSKFGLTNRRVAIEFSKLRKEGVNVPYKEEKVRKERKFTMSEDDFVKKNDIFIVVKEAAKKIVEGEIYIEADFIRQLVGQPVMRSILEGTDIKIYRGKTKGKYYWSHPSTIERLKKKGLMTD